MNRLEHLSYEKRLRLEKRRLRGILSMCINTRSEGIKRPETAFSLVSSDETRGNRLKLEYKQYQKLLTVRAFKHWSREHVESPSSETSEAQLDMALN